MNKRIHASRPTPAPVVRRRPQAGPTAPSLKAMRAEDIQALQSSAGNRATRAAVGAQRMHVGAAGDAHEREADAVAREVVANTSGASTAEGQREPVQREEEEELAMKREPVQRQEEEEELAMKREPVQREEEEELAMKREPVQREEEEELAMKREPVQREAAPEVGMDGGSTSAETGAAIEGARSGGRPLGEGVRREMEGAFGADFSGVRVHDGEQSADLNNRLAARAFTTGSDIFIGREGFNPGSRGGKELLAHELTHVVQQGAARKTRRRS